MDVEEDGDFCAVENVAPEDTGLTSGVSTLSSVISHESQRPQHPLGAHLTRLKQETSRYARQRSRSDWLVHSRQSFEKNFHFQVLNN